jgi:hypothetical protein
MAAPQRVGAEARRVTGRGVPQHVIRVGTGREARDDYQPDAWRSPRGTPAPWR